MVLLCSFTRWPQSYLKSVRVTFMVGLLTLGQVSLYIRQFYPVSIIQPILLTHIPLICHIRYVMFETDSVIK